MVLKSVLVCCLTFFLFPVVSGQVRVRIFSDASVESAVITVLQGSYEIETFNGGKFIASEDKPFIISHFNDRIAVKPGNTPGFICDSVLIKGNSGNGMISVRIMGDNSSKRIYNGDLQCLSDLGTLLLINICNVEDYVAGVVMSEGGTRQNEEYFKTQAVIARTYTYKYSDRHIIDRYNLCDNTHCQVYLGQCTDTLIRLATLHTRDQVILDSDRNLVIAAFHSNCGGETSPSGLVWLSGQPYLKRVIDPYCTSSRNARWRKSISNREWISYLIKSGYTGNTDNPSEFEFSQITRMSDYRIGSYTIPLRTIRSDFGLKSSFFSVVTEGDSVVLKGRGYGHGVGLCQEGAMVMASKGYDFRKIISFYYSDVTIADIKNAVIIEKE